MGSIPMRWPAGSGDGQRRRIVRFIQEVRRREGCSPSYGEIAAELGMAVSTVTYHVSVLEQQAAPPG
jgi:DNA-binding transcriptional ArsR family regulator